MEISRSLLGRLIDAADSASTLLLSVVGALFLVFNMGAWVRGENIVFYSQSRPALGVFLLVWLVLVLALTLESSRKARKISKSGDTESGGTLQ